MKYLLVFKFFKYSVYFENLLATTVWDTLCFCHYTLKSYGQVLKIITQHYWRDNLPLIVILARRNQTVHLNSRFRALDYASVKAISFPSKTISLKIKWLLTDTSCRDYEHKNSKWERHAAAYKNQRQHLLDEKAAERCGFLCISLQGCFSCTKRSFWLTVQESVTIGCLI